jgi:hypothetical protein
MAQLWLDWGLVSNSAQSLVTMIPSLRLEFVTHPGSNLSHLGRPTGRGAVFGYYYRRHTISIMIIMLAEAASNLNIRVVSSAPKNCGK